MASDAARRKFAPEFMYRVDETIVFRPLRKEQVAQILDIELSMLQQRPSETPRGNFVLRATQAAKEFLYGGTDLRYGARHLKRAIERHLVYPLASLLVTNQVTEGESISVDWNEITNSLIFLKKV